MNPLMTRFVLTASLCSAIPAAGLAGENTPRAEAPAGASREACARAFIAMFNKGGLADIAAFEEAFASPERRGRSSDAERHAQFSRMKEGMGSLTFEKILVEGPASLTVLVKPEFEPPHEFEFCFAEAGGLDVVKIQPASGSPPRALTPHTRGEVIDGVLAALEESYVYPEVAAKMSGIVRAKAESGGYDGAANEADLAQRLTEDLRAASSDKHISVRLAPEAPAARRGAAPQMPGLRNFGFVKTEILPGNVGYIRLDGFSEDEAARRPAAAALEFVRGADAVIFDVRYNGGGSPAMIQFLSSYLFKERTHLNSFKDRAGETVDEFWTLDEIPGERLRADMPVYVLTSGRTFSAAEEFTYNLKSLGRATIVGEKTGGGAHPVRGERIAERFIVMVPYMRAWNPVTGTNWEGVGIEPDVASAADGALDAALEHARRRARGG